MISIIAAVDQNFLMGDGEKLPWYLPADFAYFKKITTGKTVVMGSKTYFSLPEKFRPLPNRKNIVLSRNKDLKLNANFSELPENTSVEILNDILELKKMQGPALQSDKKEEIIVIGGAEIYRLALENNLVDKIYLTEIQGEFQGDIYFPKEFLENFQEFSRIRRENDEKNSHQIDFVIYKRKKKINLKKKT